MLQDDDAAFAEFNRHDFGQDFHWGVGVSAFQVEGAVHEGGRGPSIWDSFTRRKNKIKDGSNGDMACDFYHRYEEDLDLAAEMGFKCFRFSIAWSRILPEGTGQINQPGIDYYMQLIDACKARGMEPWITLYHWDLPKGLENRGGWKNREIIDWFSNYVRICCQAFGGKVRHWIVLNEPMAVAGLGYVSGLHAPGKRGIWNFLPVVHHLAMCQAEGGRIIRKEVTDAHIGTSISCSFIQPSTGSARDVRAARRADALMNRLFVEPLLGMGYPVDGFGFLRNIKKFMRPGDEDRLRFDFDFIGIQNYFSVVVRHSWWTPVLWLSEIPAKDREVPLTEMGWEVNPDGLYKILKQFSSYVQIPEFIITEGGAAFADEEVGGQIFDEQRVKYFQGYLGALLKAKREGVKVGGYLVWSLMDNFEWAEGYRPRFGLVHVNFADQKRTVKQSGRWFSFFLKKN
jgi:beta-glucosidase